MEEAVLTIAQAKNLFQQVQAFTNTGGAGKGPEIAGAGTPLATMKRHPGKVIRRSDLDVGITFVIPHQDIVGRMKRLDQRLLKQQRFSFTAGESGLDIVNARHQRPGFCRGYGFQKIAG